MERVMERAKELMSIDPDYKQQQHQHKPGHNLVFPLSATDATSSEHNDIQNQQ